MWAIIGIGWIAAAQGCDFHAPLRSSAPLEAARTLLRARVPTLVEDRHLAPDIAAATAMISDGGLARIAALNDVFA